MKILITGGAGYIGSHVVRQLSEAGQQVVVLDDLSTGHKDALVYGETLVVGDLGEADVLARVFSAGDIEAVMHFAGSIVVPESVGDPIKYYRNNTVKTLNLLEACVRHKVNKFIFSSTAAVYGLPQGGIASEGDALAPINPYGTSKLTSEWMLRDIALAHGLKYVAFRYFNVAGADPLARMGQRSLKATHLIKVCCEAAAGLRSHVDIYGTDYNTPDGTTLRDYVHVEDLASAHLAGLEYLNRGGQSRAVNVGYGTGHSVLEVVDAVKRVSGVNFKTKISPRRAGDAEVLIAKAEIASKILGWTPKFNKLDTIVADALRWEDRLKARSHARSDGRPSAQPETPANI